MMNKRKICVVVTARPSYSRVKTVIKAIEEHQDLELQLVVAASALLDKYGSAVKVIEEDGFKISAKVFNVLEGENLTAAAKTTGIGILELSTVFDNLAPDIVVTIADRFETIATAISASYMNIPLAHIQGGEVTGNIDEKVRHAITKLADYHFVASESAMTRVLKLGEEPEYVVNTGCPSIDLADEVLFGKPIDPRDLIKKYGGVGAELDISNGYLVVLQHPVTTAHKDSRKHIEESLFAIKDLDIPTLWFWPNIDAGADGTSRGIRSFRENEKASNIRFFKNMEPHDFLNLIKGSSCLIGNSSVGIRESSFLGVPVVNIGDRQRNRDRGGNVVDVDYDQHQIRDAIKSQIDNGPYPSANVYGGGDSGQRIAELLKTVPLKIDKVLTY